MGYNIGYLYIYIYWGYNPLTKHLLSSWDIQVIEKVLKIDGWKIHTWWLDPSIEFERYDCRKESSSQGSGWKEKMFEATKRQILVVRIGKAYGFRSYVSLKECSLHGWLLSCILTACLCFTQGHFIQLMVRNCHRGVYPSFS